jgi:hypothetical protein
LLHPAVEASLRSALPTGCVVTRSSEVPHLAAARLAAQTALEARGLR